ncbi:MAG: hypothetical protein GY696_21050 [Gammaproteobacteria bacterium]|nr:hypothetical protein [Gammaproteobacteria bacterium]
MERSGKVRSILNPCPKSSSSSSSAGHSSEPESRWGDVGHSCQCSIFHRDSGSEECPADDDDDDDFEHGFRIDRTFPDLSTPTL